MIVQNDYYADRHESHYSFNATTTVTTLASACRTKDKYRIDSFLLCTPMSSNLINKRIPPQDFVCNLSHARGALSIQSIHLSRTADCREPAPTSPERVSRREGLLHPFTTLFHRFGRSTSRYQRGWCFFAQRRLTLPSIIPLIDPSPRTPYTYG